MVRAKKTVSRILHNYVAEINIATLIVDFSATRTQAQLIEYLKTSWQRLSEEKKGIYAWNMMTTIASQRHNVVPEWHRDLDRNEKRKLATTLSKNRLYRQICADAFHKATDVKFGPNGTPKIFCRSRKVAPGIHLHWNPYPC